jgi:hypothetical protein
MKTPEDEAFDDMARRQGMWGGGFPAKRAAAADKLQEPAQEQEEDWGALAEKQLVSIKRDTHASFEDAMVRATHKVMAEFEAQPAQEPVADSFEEYCKTLPPLWNTHISRTYAEQFFRAGQSAQPAQEPVAWGFRSADGAIYDCISPEAHDECEGSYNVPLYTTPPLPAQPVQEPDLTAVYMSGLYDGKKKRPWIGLTDEDLLQIRETVQVVEGRSLLQSLTKAIEQALKEKNNG